LTKHYKMVKKSIISLPYKFTPRPYQMPFLEAMRDGCRRAVLVWHRRSGKDKTVVNFTVAQMLQRVGTYYHFLPFYSQGRKAVWDNVDKDGLALLSHFPEELIKSKNEQEMRIEFKNGSAWQVMGSDKADSIVGTNPVGVTFSEYSLCDPTSWDLVRPILAENGGWAVFIYTPRGMNHGFSLYSSAKANPFDAKTGKGWFSQILTVEDTHAISDDALRDELAQMPRDIYDQEYFCKFLDGSGAFFRNILENTYTDYRDHQGHSIQLGVDLAKYQDFTVLTPFCRTCFRALPQDSFNLIDWSMQKARIEALARRYNANIVIDSTGVGDPIVEDLTNSGLRVEPFKFTQITRKNLLNNLSVLLEQGRIKIPYQEELIAQLRSFAYTTTDSGAIKADVPSGMHDDRVMSLALSVWGDQRPDEEELEDIPFYASQSFS
jgi:hypothetical protein